LSDYGHGWVSGDMGNIGTSSYDPLFHAHHCNVDRIWAIWQKAHGPLDGPNAIDQALLDVELEPFGIKVRDVLDTTQLGYTYD
jgi:tyrosinase